ncbi:hypothetical protein ACW9KT_21975 [Hymenobacter sp. HD11105]
MLQVNAPRLLPRVLPWRKAPSEPLPLLLLLGCQAPSPPESSPDPAVGTAAACTPALRQAQQDFLRGAYTLHSRELVPQPSTYLPVLDQRYHLRWRFVESTTSGSYYGCYHALMRQLLESKYGVNFLHQAARQADRLAQTDQEVRRVLKQMPRGTPAYGAGHAVPQSYPVPIPFSPAICRQDAHKLKPSARPSEFS